MGGLYNVHGDTIQIALLVLVDMLGKTSLYSQVFIFFVVLIQLVFLMKFEYY